MDNWYPIVLIYYAIYIEQHQLNTVICTYNVCRSLVLWLVILPWQVTLTDEQHSPVSHDGIGTTVQCLPSPHPPLSTAREYSQYGKPVALHIWHFDPVGHGWVKQAIV